MTDVSMAAVDLGAASGRVIVGTVGSDGLQLREAHRFTNEPITVAGTLRWDINRLYREILTGLRAAVRDADTTIASVGVDSWAVDYGLVDADNALLGLPFHYRDARTDDIAAKVHAEIDPAQLYAVTGLQFLPFNTIYQLAADDSTLLDRATHALLIPDLLAGWLTGTVGSEETNASTTGLFDARTGRWADALFGQLGLRPGLFGPLRQPGEAIGSLLPDVQSETGLSASSVVTAVGSHDTASAVVGVPAVNDRFAYISCGTWSLVGVELDAPVLSEESRAANFTNERGVDGTVRYLRNVMGLWLLQESMRTWGTTDVAGLLAAAANEPALRSLINPDDPRLLPPGDMPGRIADQCRERAEPVPSSPAAAVRCILDSLALAYRRTVREAAALSGREVDVVHIVGGGARNAVLSQLTADACELPVVAGPVEATAIGNVLVQARSLGAVGGGLAELRAVPTGEPTVRYEPRGDLDWAAAERRV